MKFSSCVFLLFFLSFSIPAWSQLKSRQSSSKPTQTSPAAVAEVAKEPSPAVNNTKKGIAPNGQITLSWGKPFIDSMGGTISGVEYINFKGAIYSTENHHLPEFFKQIKLNTGSNQATVDILTPKYEPLSAEELKALGVNAKWVGPEVTPHVRVSSQNKENYVRIQFIPVRKNAFTGTYEKLVSCSLDIHQSSEPGRAGKIHTTISFASSSILSMGTWFRIGVTADGIYKLNSSFFVKAGIDTSNLLPANIRIYGNGGAMLPQSNAAYRPDDLTENAIYVHGQNDPSFKKGDYVLFYGQSPHVWTYDTLDQRFHHTVNLYSDTTFYFINIDLGPGKRIGWEPSLTSTPTNTVTTFADYAYHELDGVNLIQSGSEWFGEYFESTTQYTITFPFSNLSNSSPAYVNTSIASRNCSSSGTGYNYYTTGPTSGLATATIANVTCNPTDAYASLGSCTYTYTPVPGSSAVSVVISKTTPSAVGWLYYVETNVTRDLTMGSQSQMEFRDTKSVGSGHTSLYTISSYTPIQVWDVSNPQSADSVSFLSTSGGAYKFARPADTLKQYIAFPLSNKADSNVTFFGKVANQNLHAMPQADMIIVTNPLYLSEAEQLAAFHRSHDNLSVNVATTQQVYNEFSSGLQDPTAIRDFARMFYDRAGNSYTSSPKYLLLFGDGSFDPKHRVSGNNNYVVTYESANSFLPAGGTYVTDDYFVLLDSTVTTPPDVVNPISGTNYSLNMSVGRIPADNVTEARSCVNKIISYETASGQPVTASTACCNTQTQYNLANWRNRICFIAHDGEQNQFQDACETMADYVTANYKNLNINKIYLDAYTMVQTPGGPRYPSVNIAIDEQMNQGLLIYNYEGHGGPTGLALERVLTFNDIYSWTNVSAMPLFFNGSCAFAQWDNPLQVSGGEVSFTLPTGGVIGMMSASREVFLQNNAALNEWFIQVLYSPLPDGSLPRLGDLLTMAKNNYGGTNINNLTFCLLGDPAVRLAYPKYDIYTTSINAKTVTSTADTLKALAKVTVSGYVGDSAGNVLTSFNGLLNPTLYDKPDSITTLANLGAGQSSPMTFILQNSELYRGLISVNNGKFTFTYVMPKDILYYYGYGKFSYYAENGTTDATGNYQNLIVGGTSPTARNNGIGPKIRLYMNDSTFIYGGLTNQNPSLYAIVFDSNGVNTSGTSIGHDITAVLDNNTANTYDLSNYYQPSLNSYQKGTITFPFSSLPNGTHTLSLRVWNVYDNTAITSTEFNVEPQSSLQLQHVLNYPNPFTTHTQFFFEINEVCTQMDVQIQIFSVSGKLVRNILTSVKTDSFRSQPIDWDGKDDYGDRIARGVYIYHIKVRTSTGASADTFQKLVIL